jgi:hypothetical protein
MSKVTINGIVISSTPDYNCPLCGHPADTAGLCRVCRSTADMAPRGSAATSVTPSFATHRLVDGQWVLKGSAVSAVPTPAPARPIGFIQPTTPANQPVSTVSINGSPVFSSRKDTLRAIEIAAGKVLLAGTNTTAIESIRRGRLGGRKDNLSELHQLLRDYSL